MIGRRFPACPRVPLALLALTVFSFATVGEGDAVVSARTMTVMARGGAVAGAVVALLAVAAIVSALATSTTTGSRRTGTIRRLASSSGSARRWRWSIARCVGLLALAYRKTGARAVGLLSAPGSRACSRGGPSC